MDYHDTPRPDSPRTPEGRDAYRDSLEETRDFADLTPPKYRSKLRSQRSLGLIFVFGTLVVIGVIGYWFFVRTGPQESKPQPTSVRQSETSSKPTVASKHYISGQFGLSMDYPEDWVLTDVEGNGQLILRSPSNKFKNIRGGQDINGQIIIMIRTKQQKFPEFDKGNALATRASEKITYTQPAQNQRGQTFLSFLHLAGSTTSETTIDAMFITGDTGYQLAQAIPKADILPIEPVISVAFVKCSDSSCSEAGASVGVPSSMLDDKNFVDPIKAILTSLIIS
ncbi:hypothetical protein HY003_00250 [Candidatus Saccharibacteria bacterium]|nr:hypothetical protein [Candidatus Saccharibacteria bacterium]MBI3337722.1 hypothetical protein [Candidatus Saccharibacteria bacterium]